MTGFCTKSILVFVLTHCVFGVACYVPIDDQDCPQPVSNNCSLNLETENQVPMLAVLHSSFLEAAWYNGKNLCFRAKEIQVQILVLALTHMT